MKGLNVLALVLVIVGALNWGLVALFEWDLVAEIFGETFGTTNIATRIIYGLVGLAGVYWPSLSCLRSCGLTHGSHSVSGQQPRQCAVGRPIVGLPSSTAVEIGRRASLS